MPRGLKPKAKEVVQEEVAVTPKAKQEKQENLAILRSNIEEGRLTIEGQTFDIKNYEVKVPLELKEKVALHIRMGG